MLEGAPAGESANRRQKAALFPGVDIQPRICAGKNETICGKT